MGIFSFKKKLVQEQVQGGLIDHTLPQICVENKDPSLSFPLNKKFSLALNDSTLMDDIMNELDSSNSSTTASSLSRASTNKDAEPSSPDHNKTSPISIFSTETPTSQGHSIQRSIALNSVPDTTLELSGETKNTSPNDDNSDLSCESNDSPAIRRSVTFQDLLEDRDSAPLVKNDHKKTTTTSDFLNSQKEVMDRMEERHRREVRQSIQPSPSMNFVKYPRNHVNAHSMPVKTSATAYDFRQYHNVEAYSMNQRPLVQSQSFTVYNHHHPNNSFYVNNPSVDKMRNTFSLNNIHSNATLVPIEKLPQYYQVQNDSPFMGKPGPTNGLPKPTQPILNNKRHSYFQEPVDMQKPIQFQFKRSVSAYPQGEVLENAFKKQLLLQQQQHQYQLFMQQLQQQRLQQQFELQQQQLQEKQLIQLQQLQQLQLMNQAFLDSSRIAFNEKEQKKCHHASKKPLYERCTTKCSSGHHHCGESKHCNKQRHHTTKRKTHATCVKLKEEEETVETDHFAESAMAGDNLESHSRAEKDIQNEIKVPHKLRKELQQMKLSRSNYSLPDITQFTKEEDNEEQNANWETIRTFSKRT